MTMQEVLRTNKIATEKRRVAQLKHDRKVKRVHNIISCVILVTLVVLTIIVSNNYNKKAITECSKEHDINYCIGRLS